MKLEKRDVAECLGLVYNGTIFDEDNETGFGAQSLHYFQFAGKDVYSGCWNSEEAAWEEVSNLLLEPLVELLKERL